ncbi:oxygenase MpaB family protein [Galbitalea soli]|uniref:DUF2236 domain-containing protein n=1 Tax=Galbitalea soli TaxID=1268042 RepID=A0A7C9TRI6_9MICO|nr:oxygenase MpaB family protein [Galbitalea soli]NEM92217.1 DUF2236 domain-containing protein [Galbitalea soli]NYJ31829.1 uncharacterized protein (DUF2236 family) [Galbitalea soli]
MRPTAVERWAADGVLIVGGARAILLQVADPVVAAGVARHSDFAHRPVQRLVRTLGYAYAVVLGTEADSRAVARHVDAAHRPVAGAADADRQLWVAATLYDTAGLVHERVFGPTPTPLADEVYARYARLGTALQMPAALWPGTRAAFESYWADALERLTVTDDARSIAHDLFHPAVAPLWVRAALPLAQLLTVELLPEGIREAYGFEFGPARRRRARVAWMIVRALVAVTPWTLRSTPARRLLRRIRTR